jgi:hypothetical protein
MRGTPNYGDKREDRWEVHRRCGAMGKGAFHLFIEIIREEEEKGKTKRKDEEDRIFCRRQVGRDADPAGDENHHKLPRCCLGVDYFCIISLSDYSIQVATQYANPNVRR